MHFFMNLTNNSLECRLHLLRLQHFGLVGLNNPVSTNQGTDEGVSGLVGSVLSVREKAMILAKGGLIGPLINRLFCGTDHGIYSRQKTLKQYISYIVMRLRILHTCPHEPLLERLIEYHSGTFVCDFAVDSKTRHVAVITQNFFEVLNSNSGGRMFHSETSHSSCSNRVAFGNGDNDSILAVCSNDVICLYEGSTLCCTQKMTSSATVNTVRFSPDGRVLVICLSNNTVQVLKKKDSDDGTEEWVCVETLPDQTAEITSVAFYQQPEILILAIGLGDNTIKIWDISSDETKPSSCVDTITGHSSWVTTVSFHLYFKTLASGSNDKTVKVWSHNVDGQFICMLTLDHGSPVSSVAFSPSGFLASGSTNDYCRIWRLIMSAKRVNAELVLTMFVESGIDQLEFCQKTGNLQIRHYDGVSTLK